MLKDLIGNSKIIELLDKNDTALAELAVLSLKHNRVLLVSLERLEAFKDSASLKGFFPGMNIKKSMSEKELNEIDKEARKICSALHFIIFQTKHLTYECRQAITHFADSFFYYYDFFGKRDDKLRGTQKRGPKGDPVKKFAINYLVDIFEKAFGQRAAAYKLVREILKGTGRSMSIEGIRAVYERQKKELIKIARENEQEKAKLQKHG